MAETEVSQSAKTAVLDLKTILQDMPTNMRLFSLSMRSLYVQSAVGTNTATAQKFRKLRDDTRNNAMAYLKCILPLSTNFIASISNYFEFYEALEFEEWNQMLSDILEETVVYRQLTEVLVSLHEHILVPLKKRQDEAENIVIEYKDLQMEFEKKKKELEVSARSKREWGIGLALVPGLNTIATPLLIASSTWDAVSAVAKGAESEIQEAASLAVSKTLIPALKAFIDGITKAAQFFSIMENELKKFESTAYKGQQSPKKLFYILMNKQAKEIKPICQAFYAVLPAVRTDFLAIPTEGTDHNYVDKWLEEQRKFIKEKVSAKKLVIDLLKAITGGGMSSDPQSVSPVLKQSSL
ncbi:uncharacterized protein LOC144629876 [Oculina patagonica]